MGSFLTNYGRIMGLFEKLLQLIPRNESTPLSHLQRELGLLWWVVLMFGVIDPDKEGRYYVLDQDFLSQSSQVLDRITREVERIVSSSRHRTGLELFADEELRDLLLTRRVRTEVTAMRRVAYWSQGRQPMRTWMFKIQPIPEGMERPTMQELLEHVWELACLAPLVYVDRDGEIVTFGGTLT